MGSGLMREVGQVCGGCGRRRFVQVDAWAGRPGLTGFELCKKCRRRAAAGEPASGSAEQRSELQVAPLLFFAFVIVGVVAGLVQVVV